MLVRSGLLLALGLLLGRLLGFGRELGVAARFGATGMADAIIFTLTFPDLLMTIFFGGVLSTVLVTEFVRLGEQGSWVLHRQVTQWGGALALAMAICLAACAEPVVRLLAPGVSVSTQELMAHGVAWSAWLMPLIVCATATTVWLQALQRFAASAFSTLLYNAVVVMAIWTGLPAGDPLRALALAMVAAGLLRCFWLWFDLRGCVNPTPPHGMDWVAMFRRYLDALLTSIALFLVPVIGRAMATGSGDGGMALYNYASKLVELPLAVAITLVSVVVFSPLARLVQQKEDWASLWRSSARVVVGLSVMICLTTFAFGQELTSVAFGWGQLSETQLKLIADMTITGMLSLIFQGVYALNNVVLSALHETRRMMFYSLAGLMVFILAAWIGFWFWEAKGLMVALTAAYGVMVLLQLFWLGGVAQAGLADIFDNHFIRVLVFMILASLPFFLIPSSLGRWLGLVGAFCQFIVLTVVAVGLHPRLRLWAGDRFRSISK
ncbi:murein biosynthesis integral membrane protein MurJ [Fluviicoccus keumensis]|uniref:murein biosynthesis integral membrane protein MurJ n=1 Tax=Fluviicoccus keumensis TaxID=1435465 RepID=UPI0013EE8322|nr:lipid II flippase MurJ [Fluviicoccus keumensis]